MRDYVRPKKKGSKNSPGNGDSTKLNVFRIAKEMNIEYFEYLERFTMNQYYEHLIMSELDADVSDYMQPKKDKKNK